MNQTTESEQSQWIHFGEASCAQCTDELKELIKAL